MYTTAEHITAQNRSDYLRSKLQTNITAQRLSTGREVILREVLLV